MKFLSRTRDWWPMEGIRTAFANQLNSPEIQLALGVLRDEALNKASTIPLNGVANGVAAQKQAEMAGYFSCLMDLARLAGAPPTLKEQAKNSGWIDRPLYSSEDQIPKT